jgi:collagenase-like PrtC family protease
MKELTEIIAIVHHEGIKVNLVLNTTCEGDECYSPEAFQSLLEYLGSLHEVHGIDAITLANPIYIKEVRKNFPRLVICASVLADIDCVDKAVYFNQIGADIITPDVTINRNLQLLRDIKKATTAELKIMVNEGCLYKCPFRKFHFNYISHKSKKPDKSTITSGENNPFSNNCIQLSSNDHSQILKSGWIRPEDLNRYEGITNYFKLVGRTNSKRMVMRSVKAYLDENWDGDLLELMSGNLYSLGMSNFAYLNNKSLDHYGFFEKTSSCNRECHRCNYCNDLAKKLVKLGVFSTVKLEDMGMEIISSSTSVFE